eukprot:14514466-Alexandrium_andersonii.AAC.1
MSASLVGSEMCIRDSSFRSWRPWCSRTRRTWRLPARARWLLVVALQRPVSYTHLTLPTICSV